MTFYQSTISGTRFEAVTPDDEEVGLENFHEPEERAVRSFSKDDADVLVMGGISGTGKTYTLKRLGQALGFDFVDFHMVGQHIYKIDEAIDGLVADGQKIPL